jgi:hypothetical protein
VVAENELVPDQERVLWRRLKLADVSHAKHDPHLRPLSRDSILRVTVGHPKVTEC